MDFSPEVAERERETAAAGVDFSPEVAERERETATARVLACLRGFLDGVAVVEERNGGGAARDGGQNCREKWRREIAERAARTRKKGAAVMSPN